MSNIQRIPLRNSLKVVDGTTNRIKQKDALPVFTKSSAITSSSSSSAPRITSFSSISKSNTSDVDEQSFLENFERVPTVHVQSSNGGDLDKQLKIYHDVLKNKNEDWEKRVYCLKKIRSLTLAGAFKNEGFHERLAKLLPAFHLALEDLRSRVVGETCITVAFLSKTLKNKLEHFVELLLPSILKLLQRTKKVFVSVASTCVRFILQHTHAPRMIPLVANNLNNKSNKIRRACSEFIHLILQMWRRQEIEKFAPIIQESIRKGVSDSDAETRSHSRHAYFVFALHFPHEAERLKDSVDLYYRKLLSSDPHTASSSLSGSSVCLSSDANPCEGQQVRNRRGSMVKLGSTQGKENYERLSISRPTPASRIPFSTKLINLNNGNQKISQQTTSVSFSRGPVASPILSFREKNGIFSASFFSERDVFLKDVAEIMSHENGEEGAESPSFLDDLNNTTLSIKSDDLNYELFCRNVRSSDHGGLNSNYTSERNITTNGTPKALKSYLDKFLQASKSRSGSKLAKPVEHHPSNTIITHFRPLLAEILMTTLPSKPIRIRKSSLNMLQLIVEKNDEVVHLLEEFSDLVIAQVISLCADPNKGVVEAAKTCAIVLSTRLPASNVMRIVVPLINMDNRPSVKLICIEMLMHLVGRSDNEVILENIHLIEPVLKAASNSEDIIVRKTTLSCMEALLRNSNNIMTK